MFLINFMLRTCQTFPGICRAVSQNKAQQRGRKTADRGIYIYIYIYIYLERERERERERGNVSQGTPKRCVALTQCVPEPPGAGGHSCGACGCRTPPCSPSGVAAGPESDPGPPSQRYTTALAPGVAPCPEDAEKCLGSPQWPWRLCAWAVVPRSIYVVRGTH